MHSRRCRFCSGSLDQVFADLGCMPAANSYVSDPIFDPNSEPSFPLKACVCSDCLLVQLTETVSPEKIFSEYAYFSSYSDTWVKHCKDYAEAVSKRFGLNASSQVVEIASNDGSLLLPFVEKGIPVLGIEPARNVSAVARERGVPTKCSFFTNDVALELVVAGNLADVLVANNVLAHVPDINDFVKGMRTILRRDGVATVEFPHLLNLIEKCQFDTIYHEHFFYYSFHAAEALFQFHGLSVFDVERLPTHGGSLRLYLQHSDTDNYPISSSVAKIREMEKHAELLCLSTYAAFDQRVRQVRSELVALLQSLRADGKKIVAYGAPAKGNTLLNYCDIGTDIISYTVDRNPHKQNHWLPGSHIPILNPDVIQETKPDCIMILPWNLETEILAQLDYARSWGASFILPIPNPRLVS